MIDDLIAEYAAEAKQRRREPPVVQQSARYVKLMTLRPVDQVRLRQQRLEELFRACRTVRLDRLPKRARDPILDLLELEKILGCNR